MTTLALCRPCSEPESRSTPKLAAVGLAPQCGDLPRLDEHALDALSPVDFARAELEPSRAFRLVPVAFRLESFVFASCPSFLRFSVVIENWVSPLFSCSGLHRLTTGYYAVC